MSPPTRRISSGERRQQIVTAATAVFGARGYVGTTTDDIARAAGVSQPYVVRLFGTKENLFVAALRDAIEQLSAGFREALSHAGDLGERKTAMADAYAALFSVRGLHQLLSQSFLLGGHPVIGPEARRGFSSIWRLVRDEAGFDQETAREFMASGMLVNTMLGLRVAQQYGDDPGMTELLDSCFPTKIGAMLSAAPKVEEPW